MVRDFVARCQILTGPAPLSRGGRLTRRMNGKALATIADAAAVPEWLGWSEDRQQRVFQAAALLHCRSALDREIDGTRLAAIAHQCGEPLLDAACAADHSGTSDMDTLAGALDDLAGYGRSLVEPSAPVAVRDAYPGAAGSAEAASLAARAGRLVQQAEALA